jgi:hypothetical protein
VYGMMRTAHVLAVALWFGSVVFFTVSGVLIFNSFERESLNTENRPLWFPLPGAYQKPPPPESNFPDPLVKEQGSRAAGVAVSGIFTYYYALQTKCGAFAVLTAFLLLLKRGTTLDRIRLVVCVLGLALVLAGWWVERLVEEKRKPRNDNTDAVLKAESPSAEQIAAAREARAEFGKWHGISLLLNFGVLGLTLVAVGMAAHWPEPASGKR